MTATTAEKSGGEGAFGLVRWVRGQMQQFLAFVSLIVIVVFFSLANPNFLTPSNVTGILVASVTIGLLALGTTAVIISGGIDLSIGTAMILSGVMTGVFLVNWNLPLWVGVLGGVLFGAFVGLVNGLVVAYLGIPPFIATLAMMLVTIGASLVISGTQPIRFTKVDGFSDISNASLIPGARLPISVVLLAVMALIAGFVLAKTRLGRYSYAIGSNEEATRLSGVDVRRWKVAIYTFSGFFVGLAGVLAAARLNSAQPTGGQGLELEAIAAVVIGGTSLAGGRGTITGTVIGILIMSVLTNGLRIMSIPQEWQSIAVGAVILVAVYIDIVRKRT
ncbi:ABC transporter permease [Tsukamurella sp. 1534]|uniref:ABC transporter permease n=1 Tax=Tsukamurella sp. 1534 TaxID=1151061 RepID=UPI00031F83AA|nr:ABC transporter permease [Tsukamurella sp. 1534]